MEKIYKVITAIFDILISILLVISIHSSMDYIPSLNRINILNWSIQLEEDYSLSISKLDQENLVTKEFTEIVIKDGEYRGFNKGN